MASLFTEKIIEVGEDYRKLQLAPDHREVISSIAALMQKYLDISNDLAMRGFIWRAMKKYQVENKRTVADVAKSDPETRIRETKKIFDLLAQDLKKFLKDPSKQDTVTLAVNNAFEFYKQNFAHREV